MKLPSNRPATGRRLNRERGSPGEVERGAAARGAVRQGALAQVGAGAGRAGLRLGRGMDRDRGGAPAPVDASRRATRGREQSEQSWERGFRACESVSSEPRGRLVGPDLGCAPGQFFFFLDGRQDFLLRPGPWPWLPWAWAHPWLGGYT